MTNPNPIRQAIGESVQNWLNLWQGNAVLKDIFSENAQLFSLQHGNLSGSQAIAERFLADNENGQVRVFASNRFIAGKGDFSAVSLYLYGDVGGRSFCGQAVLRLQFYHHNKHWQIDEIRLMSSFDNEQSTHRQRWQPFDNTAIIISELHSPYHLFADNELTPDDEQSQLDELYARYSWGLDMADGQILADALSDDIHIDMPPMGEQIGKHNAFGQLKQFRHAVSFCLHIGNAIESRIDGDNAEIFQGRVISERYQTEDGKKLYCAYYNLKAHKDSDGVWRYRYMDYFNEWFTAKNEQ